MSRPAKKPKNTPEKTSQDVYFRIRDFEYVQPLYDLAFLLEVDALAKGKEVPKYRTFNLWRAGFSLDGYGTTIDRWLDGVAHNDDLDYVPSLRIRAYLNYIRKSGTIPELRSFRGERYARCLRLRSVRGLGPSQIALMVSSRSLDEEWFTQAAMNLSLQRNRILELYNSSNTGPWQTAHIVPPLLRFLHSVESAIGKSLRWKLSGITDPFEPVRDAVIVSADAEYSSVSLGIVKSLKTEKHFRGDIEQNGHQVTIKHQMGWSFSIVFQQTGFEAKSILELMRLLDPLSCNDLHGLNSDLHLHTAWSDGSASVDTMAKAVVASGLKFLAVTDHSRSSKLQGGLTPVLWLRQANALTLVAPVCRVLHGIEVDILKDGSLDLPRSLLLAADIVVASVHSNWEDDPRVNTDRLLKAIESGCIDILAHPTSAVIGKPAVPDYWRPPADVYWEEVFRKCAEWNVALEMNCFPSRLDLPLSLLQKAVDAGCAISFGSDAHARSHLLNLRFANAALLRLAAPFVLNRLSHNELKQWIAQSRKKRSKLTKSLHGGEQSEFLFDANSATQRSIIEARVHPPKNIPAGSRIVGIDLTAGNKATGVALLDKFNVKTCSLRTDEQILSYIHAHKPKIVSIDSPLGLPGGGTELNRKSSIVREAEYDLASIGISAYPALIDSMKNLTLRGIRLRRSLEGLPKPPIVIESYPGAAQDILCIPRKQKSLGLLREGLRRLGLTGEGLDTHSHDEMDAITSAIVGRYFESDQFEPMGIPSEAQLIVPKISPLLFRSNPVICLGGKTGAGKSVVARYLSVFYGFKWIPTRNFIRELLLEDIKSPMKQRMFRRSIDTNNIKESDLRDFGVLILDKYKQEPMYKKLTKTIKEWNFPIVVDSIREKGEIQSARNSGRPVSVWYIDCKESLLSARRSARTKMGQKVPSSASPIDKTALEIKKNSDNVISNSGSLEELRWKLDDCLFQWISMQETTETSI